MSAYDMFHLHMPNKVVSRNVVSIRPNKVVNEAGFADIYFSSQYFQQSSGDTKGFTYLSAKTAFSGGPLPALRVEDDSTSARLNQTNFVINRPGLFCCQWSEISETNPSFIIIVIERAPF
uniref:Cytochrome oxidase subunit II copper A binding domain-containing protein n=1 Tax=Glossina palpalis gambiensis TaxID=67801 RepID=A0A1B0BY09_9MUSC